MVTDQHVFMSRETTRDRAFSAFLIFSYKYACMLSLSMQPNLMSHFRSFALTVASTVVYSVTTHGRKCCDNIFLQLNFILRSLSKMLRCWLTWQWQNVKRKLKDSRFSGRQTGGVFFFSLDPFLPLLWLIKIFYIVCHFRACPRWLYGPVSLEFRRSIQRKIMGTGSLSWFTGLLWPCFCQTTTTTKLGTWRSDDAMAAKASLKKWIYILPVFIRRDYRRNMFLFCANVKCLAPNIRSLE